MSDAQANWQVVEREIRDIRSDVDALYECSIESAERLEQIVDAINKLIDASNRHADRVRENTLGVGKIAGAILKLTELLTVKPPPSPSPFSELFKNLVPAEARPARKPKLQVVKNDEVRR